MVMAIELIFFLAAIQGFTEFLPVSSSAHLALIPALTGAADQGLFIDVAAHVGSLLAVMWHYRARVAQLLTFRDRGLMAKLALSFLPVLALGVFISPPRGVAVIAINSIVFGIILWLADRYGKSGRNVSLSTAFVAGLAQVVALIPGVSRSGITISAMRARGIGRAEALDFAFLMSMPAIAAAGGWELIHAIKSPQAVNWGAAGLTMAISAVFSLMAIRFMLGFVRRFSFAGFSVYRVILGAALLLFFV